MPERIVFEFRDKKYIQHIDDDYGDHEVNMVLRKVKQHFYDGLGLWYEKDKFRKEITI